MPLILGPANHQEPEMKSYALICLCLFGLTLTAGCGESSEPVTEEAAVESESVDSQLESAGMSEQDYEKAMQESQQQSGQ